MKNIWRWFCRIGRSRGKTARPGFLPAAEKRGTDGASSVCTRICGHEGCRCGGTMRGLYCVWSYYRVPQDKEQT